MSEHGHRGGVADEHEVGARFVGEAASRRVVRGHHHDRLSPRLHLRELGDREPPGCGRGGCGLLRADAHCLSFEDDVVDEASRADANGAGENGGIEVGDLDVVDLEAVRRTEQRERGIAVARRERARERESCVPLLGGQERIARRERESVGVSNGRQDAELDLESEVADHRPDHLCLLRVLLPEVGPSGTNDREQLEDDRRHAAEVAGTKASLEDRAELGDVDPGLEAGRVHLVG